MRSISRLLFGGVAVLGAAGRLRGRIIRRTRAHHARRMALEHAGPVVGSAGRLPYCLACDVSRFKGVASRPPNHPGVPLATGDSARRNPW